MYFFSSKNKKNNNNYFFNIHFTYVFSIIIFFQFIAISTLSDIFKVLKSSFFLKQNKFQKTWSCNEMWFPYINLGYRFNNSQVPVILCQFLRLLGWFIVLKKFFQSIITSTFILCAQRDRTEKTSYLYFIYTLTKITQLAKKKNKENYSSKNDNFSNTYYFIYLLFTKYL